MNSRQKNVTKIVAITIVSMLIAMGVEFYMFNQYGYSLSSAAIWGRVSLIIFLAIVLILLAAWDAHFSNYATILIMLYYLIIDLGGVMQVRHRTSIGGIIMQMLSLAGVLVCLYGIGLGVRQRTLHNRAVYEQTHQTVNKSKAKKDAKK